MPTISTDRAAAKSQLLARLPATLGTEKTAEVVGVHAQTVRELERKGKLPFRNVSLVKKSYRYLASDVVDYLFGDTPTSKKGRPVGSRNKPKDQKAAE